jgi:hypothetical protein
MSQQNSDPTIYDGLMFVALGAVIVGIVFLCLTLDKYGWSAPSTILLPMLKIH